MSQGYRDLACALTAGDERLWQRHFIKVMMTIRNCVTGYKCHLLFRGSIESGFFDLAIATKPQPVGPVRK